MIDYDESAKLYFQKSESVRNISYNFWTIVINGILVAIIPEIITGEMSFTDEYLDEFTWISIGIMLLILAIELFIKQKYREYFFNYVMFYSVPFLHRYSSDHKITIKEISKDDLTEIVRNVREKTYFDDKCILRGLYTYCYKVTNIRPDWIEKK